MALASKLPVSFDTVSTDVQRIQAVLRSNSVADEVIKKFDLEKYYETAHIEQARTALWEHCVTAVDRKSSVVSLTCEDKDPKQAMAMAAFFGDVGNRVFGRVSASSAREERRFLEGQVEKARKDVDETSRKLREFQVQHKIIDLPEQSKATISAMAAIQGDLISKQLELSYRSSFSASTESSVVQLQKQIGIMEAKLKQLEAAQATPGAAGSAAGSNAGEFFPNAMLVPELRFELEGLLREQKIAETVFLLMTQRFEAAKIDEARDTSTFQILDYPTLPTYRSRPQRKKVVISGFLAGTACGIVLVVLPAWWRRRSTPST
jgi:capsule polysaccharide export protein KpsE/RkpR